MMKENQDWNQAKMIYLINHSLLSSSFKPFKERRVISERPLYASRQWMNMINNPMVVDPNSKIGKRFRRRFFSCKRKETIWSWRE
jgi:hypothetical protein